MFLQNIQDQKLECDGMLVTSTYIDMSWNFQSSRWRSAPPVFAPLQRGHSSPNQHVATYVCNDIMPFPPSEYIYGGGGREALPHIISILILPVHVQTIQNTLGVLSSVSSSRIETQKIYHLGESILNFMTQNKFSLHKDNFEDHTEFLRADSFDELTLVQLIPNLFYNFPSECFCI